jgi:hypothetical protein
MGRGAESSWVCQRYLDECEMLDGGYILEANRQFFHLLGLELVAQLLDDGLRLRVLDWRELPAGVVFSRDDGLSETRRCKVGRIGSAWEMRAQIRLARYGFIVQPPEQL